MLFSIRHTCTAALLALLVMPTGASAQPGTSDPATPPTLFEQYQMMHAQLIIDFWTPRLNEYKEEIDRLLSVPDLVDLNELRARYSILLDRQRCYDAEVASRHEVWDDTTDISTVSKEEGFAIPDSSAASIDRQSAFIDYEAIERTRQREEEQAQAEQDRENRNLLERLLDGDEQAERALGNRVRRDWQPSEEISIIYEETPRIIYAAEWIGRKYKPAMEDLVARFNAEYDNYRAAARMSIREFFRTHRDAIVRDGNLIGILSGNLISFGAVQPSPQPRAPITFVYSPPTEAALMTYNGEDLRDLLMVDGLLPFANQAAGRLPAANILAQNSPNPATSQTVISYTLSEPGSKTILQVLDSRGRVIATFDQGTRNAGEHDATIDVTTMAPGTYLYQLRVTTSAGERLYSKSMTIQK